MTTTTTTDRTLAVANGTTPIPFNFQAVSAAEVGVLLNDVLQIDNFTVDLNGDGTGTVTPAASWGSGNVVVFSNPDFTQPADFQRYGPVYPDQYVPPLDRLARGLIALRGRQEASDVVGTPLRAELLSDTGSTLIRHKALNGNYGRTMRGWGEVGGYSEQNIFNWIDDDLDPDLLDGSNTVDLVNMIANGIDVRSVRGGLLYFPRSTYLVGALPGHSSALNIPSNVALEGDGLGTILKRANAAPNCHVINIDDSANIRLRNLTVDGNRAGNTTTGHGIRVYGVDGLLIENVWIHDTYTYGLGIQGAGQKRLTVNNLFLSDINNDALDLKNHDDLNEDVVLNNIKVKRWGLDLTDPVCAAIDVRGPARLSNIHISEPGASDAAGIRFRDGELLSTNGYGGHRSALVNFDIRMAVPGLSQLGITSVARDVTIANGYIRGGLRCYSISESGNRLTNCTAESATDDGFKFNAAGGGFDADQSVVTACQAISCGADGFEVGADRVQFVGCVATGNGGWGVRVLAAADKTQIIGGDFSSNTSGFITDAGTNSIIRTQGFSRTYTVAQLATAITSPFQGQEAYVTDANSTTFGATVVGGGSNKVPVRYDGANWKIG